MDYFEVNLFKRKSAKCVFYVCLNCGDGGAAEVGGAQLYSDFFGLVAKL